MAGHKILVIDDSRVNRARVRDMLPPGNFDVIEAKDGQEGLELIAAESPNLILLDFLIPKVTGWQVFQEIQSQPEFKKIPLIIMSGRKEDVTAKIPEPFDRHYFIFLEKPFEKKELMGGIKYAMELAKKRPAEGEESDKVEAGDGSTKIQELEARVEKLESEMASLIKIVQQKLK